MGGLFSTYLRNKRLALTKEFKRRGWLEGAVLDIGCWHAGARSFLRKEQRYIGIDLDKEAIQECKKLHKDASFFVVDLERDKLPSLGKKGKVDAIIMTAVIEHIKNVDNFFSQVKDVLKPKGKLLITTPTPIGNVAHALGSQIGLTAKEAADEHVSIFNRKKMNMLCRKHGLRLAKHKTFEFGMNQYFVVEA